MGWLYLVIAILGFSSLSLVCKLGQLRGSSSLGLVAMLMVTASAMTAVLTFGEGLQWSWTTVILGAVGGVGGGVAFALYVVALRTGHYAFSGAMLSASFLNAVLFSVIYWGEPMGLIRAAGILMLVLAIGMIAASSTDQQDQAAKARWGRWALLMLGAFILNGIPQVCQAALAKSGGQINLFLLSNFIIGSAMLAPMAASKGRMLGATIIFGTLAGLASVVGNVFNIMALTQLPPSVVLPTSMSGMMAAAILLSRLVFKERISPLGYAGLICEVVGIVLLAGSGS